MLNDYLDWPDVGQVCKLVRTTTVKGLTTSETQYAITSAPRGQADAAKLLEWWRGLWKIENGVHYVRDVTLGEDASRIRTSVAPENMAAIRNAVISLLRADKTENIAATLREFAWKPQRLFAMFGKPIN